MFTQKLISKEIVHKIKSNLWRKFDDRNRIFSSLSSSKPKVPAVLPLANSLSENNRSTQAKTTSAFWTLQGLQQYFPEKFSFQLKALGKLKFYRVFGSENFRIPFSTKNSLTWGVKWKKLNFRKS